jgi:hypothetical protein
MRQTACARRSLAGMIGDGTRGREPMPRIKRRDFIALLGGALFLFLWISAAAQEGYYGEGHDKWHQDFYSKLKRNDGRGPCCSLMDCRPTQSRMVGDHYEVKVDGEWIQVPNDKIKSPTLFAFHHKSATRGDYTLPQARGFVAPSQ